MFRTIRSILILLLIGITASCMPLYSSNINMDSLVANISLPNISLRKNIVSVTTEKNRISSNHVQIVYGFSPKSNSNYTNFFFDESEPFTIELRSNEKNIPDLSLDDLVSSDNYRAMEFYAPDDIKYVTFEFDQEKLDLPDGSYNLKIIPNIKDREIDMGQSEFIFDFSTEGDYMAGSLTLERGQAALSLYFPDNEFNYLIPVTRIIRSNAYPLTTTIRNLEQGPSQDLGLPRDFSFPLGSSAGRVANTAYVRLPRNIGEFDQGSTGANLVINSFVRSLTSLDGISSVQFNPTGQYSEDVFHGVDFSQPFSKLEEVEIYTGYIANTKRFLLSPIPLDSFTDQASDINIRNVFNLMKFDPGHGIYNAKRHPLVPSNVDLLEYSIDSGMLTLIFNEDFLNVYKDRPDRHKMMVDGIILTLMSIGDIDSIDIKVRPVSENDGQLINFELNMPIYPNLEDLG